jgi:ankyrin repeat protein
MLCFVCPSKQLSKGAPSATEGVAAFSSPPLLEAAKRGDVAALLCLLDAGGNTETADDVRSAVAGFKASHTHSQSLWTPLHYAGNGGYIEVATLLLERGADKDAKTSVCPVGGKRLYVPTSYSLAMDRVATRRYT